MIIFYNKQTGKIEGTIEGRVHSKSHFDMWIGDKKEVDRLVVNWNQKEKGANFVPDHVQVDIFTKLDNRSSKIREYKVDVKTKLLSKI